MIIQYNKNWVTRMMYSHKACRLSIAGHIFFVFLLSVLLTKAIRFILCHYIFNTAEKLNLTATRQNYNDTSPSIAILSPVRNGHLHVWCSRVLGTVQLLIEVLESMRTIMISILWQDNQLLTIAAVCVLL